MSAKQSQLTDEIEKFLRTIKKSQCFPQKMKIYAPTCYNECLPTVHKLISELNEIFKGSTIYDAEGSWWDEDKKDFDTEPIKVIEIAQKCQTKQQSIKFAKALMEYGTKASQKALSIQDREFYIARSPEIAKAYVKTLKRAKR